jgi:ATP-dependent helicase HrpB
MGETPLVMLPPRNRPGADLPIRPALVAVTTALSRDGAAVLVAPPGSGKTSLLPLALADAVTGRVIVAEPRRIATRAAARRLAWLLGEPVGGRVGYAVRGERHVSTDTRVEVVTTGLLVRRLQHDPELSGVGAIVIDECHERHLDSDLALAFCLDIRAALRADLRLVATSATPDTARMSTVLGSVDEPAPIITAQAQSYPVDVIWAAPPRPIPPSVGPRIDPRLLDHIGHTITRAVHESDGDVLVFLPGESEIRAVRSRLTTTVEVLELFGRQRAVEQDRALAPSTERRIVLATDIAESSLTVPGVRIVVDSGLAREPRTDHNRGLSRLVTTAVSHSSAHQRAGRAGREGPGRVYRCWSAADDVHLSAHSAPEIATTDLAGFALSVAHWGSPGGVGLALLDDPPAVALNAATTLLHDLQAVDERGRITPRGRAISDVGIHPRLARALIDGAPRVGAGRAREVVAALSADALSRQDDDLVASWRALRTGTDPAVAARWRDEVHRLERVPAGPNAGPRGVSDDQAAAIIVGLAYPERLARVRTGGGSSYLTAGGTGAALTDTSTMRGIDWLAIAGADRAPGRADARIRGAVPIDEVDVREIGAGLLRIEDDISWRDGDLICVRTERLGAINLGQRPLLNPDPDRVLAAVIGGLRHDGLGLLRWSQDAEQLRARLAFCHRFLGEPWPDVGDAALTALMDHWLGPDLVRVRRGRDLGFIDTGAALRRLLPWPRASRFDVLAPIRMVVPTGGQVRLTYHHDDPPVLALRVQEAFGWLDTPMVADGRVAVVLHLLSPAGRPVAITTDLGSFWKQGYPQVRSELRGRYPRHPWPEDPLKATATRRVKPRGR